LVLGVVIIDGVEKPVLRYPMVAIVATNLSQPVGRTVDDLARTNSAIAEYAVRTAGSEQL
jgi:hypothetical protein